MQRFIIPLAAAMMLTTAPAHGEPDAMVGFKTPSDNIHCQVEDWDGPVYLRCDVSEIQGRVPPKPRDCEFDWGQAFSVSRDKRRAQRICYQRIGKGRGATNTRLRVKVAEGGIHVRLKAKWPYLFQSLRFRVSAFAALTKSLLTISGHAV